LLCALIAESGIPEVMSRVDSCAHGRTRRIAATRRLKENGPRAERAKQRRKKGDFAWRSPFVL